MSTDTIMTTAEARALLEALARRVRVRRGLRYALWALAAALLAGAAVYAVLDVSPRLAAAVGCGVGAAGLLMGGARLRAAQIDAAAVAVHLDRTRPALEESTGLALQDEEDLAPMQRLQRRRVLAALAQEAEPAIVPGQGLRRAAGVATAALVCGLLLVAWKPRPFAASPPGAAAAVTLHGNEAAPGRPAAEVSGIQLKITPPAYTRRPARTAGHFGVEVPQGAALAWRVALSRPVAAAWLRFSDGDSLRLHASEDSNVVTARRAAGQSQFYALELRAGGDAVYRSDFFPLTVTPDRAPVVTVEQPEARTVLEPGEALRVQVEDDYGVGRARLVATVAKGSGENVKFREEALPFDDTRRRSRRAWTLTKMLNLDALGLEPGDELYAHVEAWDERAPEPQQARSETFFILRKDTARWAEATPAALGVNPMPAYFRSQRQIIIDTKKLIAEQSGLSEKARSQRANKIGIDQKVLRLRYGKFLGEEFESGKAEPGHAHEEGLPIDSREEEHGGGHEGHDEHAFDEQAAADGDPRDRLGGHDHPPGMAPENPFSDGQAEAMQEYMHAHDTREGATFYSEDVKRELKAALAQMWEAELRLRTVRLEAALPYEEEALRMIKALQQKARVYVQRIGFEPPPLKPAENRLTGDLEDVESRAEQTDVQADLPRAAVRAALTVLGELERGAPVEAEESVRALQAAGETLGQIAAQGNARALAALGELRVLIDALKEGEVSAQERARIEPVRAALWDALPPADPLPTPNGEPQDALSRAYFEAF